MQEMIKDKTLQNHLYLQPLWTHTEAGQVVMDCLALKVVVDEFVPMDVGSLSNGKAGGKGGEKSKKDVNRTSLRRSAGTVGSLDIAKRIVGTRVVVRRNLRATPPLGNLLRRAK
eukprot:5791382-Amphidinium_carterae.1